MSVDAGWPVAMPPVAGFLEMFAGVPYNRDKNECLACTTPPMCFSPVAGFLEMFAGVLYNREKNESLACTPTPYSTPPNLIRYIDMRRTEKGNSS